MALASRNSVGFFCKSFRDDFAHLEHLLQSFARHNPDQLSLVVSLPEADIAEFQARFGRGVRNVTVVADESYCGHDLQGLSGWHGQQVCKLMSWRVMPAVHYAVLDSDCYFISDVRAADLRPRNPSRFVACGSTLRTVMKTDNVDLVRYVRGELDVQPDWLPQRPDPVPDRLSEFVHYKDLPQDDPDAIARSAVPYQVFGSARWMYYQPGQFFSVGLLERLHRYFADHGLSVADAIRICPWEYNWYGEYAATRAYADTEFRVSPYLHFQESSDLQFARDQSITEKQLAARFFFVQMAARHLKEFTFD